MELSSHVTANLDLWVENGFINAPQREAIAQLIEVATQDAFDFGYDRGEYDSYDDGYNEGIRDATANSFDEGYQAALTEHGIEE